MPQSEEAKELELGEEPEEFGELVRYTLAGYVGGLVLGSLLDHLGFQSAVGRWLVRTLAGEGESLLEGLYALRKRIGRSGAGMADENN